MSLTRSVRERARRDATYSFTLRGTEPGQKSVATTMTTPLVLGTTEEVDLITVQ